MSDTNFELAPPGRDVDGLHAVPIDIQRITAHLVFDGATQASTGDATLEFTAGTEDGCPIFDLRQTITGVWLDGAPVAVAKAASHDFGGGSGAGMRVLAQVLTAGTAHTLRVTYTLGIPQASTAGSYQPGLSWSAGPRLSFNFGFTDLGPGRYLESWVPANLIFDQYEVILELEVRNTAIAHSLITNGSVTSMGSNHWSAAFPARVAAFSTMIELHASDAVASQTGTVMLPGTGMVTIEAWKPLTSTVNLATEITALQGFLSTDATAIGPYMHGSRFVVYFAGGGMEYDGGTTSSAGSLQHETHHSWWGRGVKPASQNDGWLDEAWTVYVTAPLSPLAFNAADPPVVLYSQNPWVRATPGESYTSGARLFQGFASMAGDAALRGIMASFYQNRPAKPITTIQMEGHLLSQSGRPEVVDEFHRWVYGFGEPATAPDLWMRDDTGHTGTEAWAGRFWDSPDLWVRNHDDGGVTHQNPIAGRDNWFYARVRNRGATAAHFMVTFVVKEYLGTEFVYPGDFLPATAASGGFQLASGASVVVKALWPAAQVPAAGSHGCLLASAHARNNHPVGGRHVWEENALAQKNLTIVPVRRGGFVVTPVLAGQWTLTARTLTLELRRPEGFPNLQASILFAPAAMRVTTGRDAIQALDCAVGLRDAAGLAAPANFLGGKEAVFAEGATARVETASNAGFPVQIGLRIEVPKTAIAGSSLVYDLVQLDGNKRPVGGVAVMVMVTA
jgi:hypothetical protein